MSMSLLGPPSSLRGLSRLTIDAIAEMTQLVETMHHTILSTPGILDTASSGPTKGITGLVYRSIRGVNTLVGSTLDVLLAQLDLLPSERSVSFAGEAARAALNGALGDYLEDSNNPLAISMCFRRDANALRLETLSLATTIAQPTDKLLILVHGLGMNDRQWTRTDAPQGPDQDAITEAPRDPWSLLARELGYTLVHLHYNSGRHISRNGREFAKLLEILVRQWPLPVRELAIIGHSMGGLVSRSACHYGAMAGHHWLQHLRSLVFLGTPHHGAPLERASNWVDVILGASPYTAPFARLGKIRSAGITDLRYGNLLDEDWAGRDRFERTGDPRSSLPLPADAQCYAMAATTQKTMAVLGAESCSDRARSERARSERARSERAYLDRTVVDRLPGDGLVPVRSALGYHDEPALRLAIPECRQWIGYGINHLGLLTHPAVRQQIRLQLAPEAMPSS